MAVLILYAMLLLSALFFSKVRFGKFLNLVSVFTAFWAVCGVLSSLGIDGVRTPSALVHGLACLFVVTADGVMLMLMHPQKRAAERPILSGLECPPVYAGAAPLRLLAFLLISVLFFRGVRLLFTGGFSAIRSSYYGEEYAGKYILSLLCRQAPIGLTEGLTVYYLYLSLFYGKIKYLLRAIVNTVILTVATGGRYEILFFVFAVAVLLLLGNTRLSGSAERVFRRWGKRLSAVGVLFICVGVYITVQGRTADLYRGIVSYGSGSLSFLDLILENPGYFRLTGHSYGYMTFGAIVEPPVLLLKALGAVSVKTPSWFFNSVCQPFYDIGTNGTHFYFNNNTSILYFLLSDFGWAGVPFGGVLAGGAISFFYNRMSEKRIFYNLLFVYSGIVLLQTPMYHRFFGCNPFFTVLALWICSRRVRWVVKPVKVSLSGSLHPFRR